MTIYLKFKLIHEKYTYRIGINDIIMKPVSVKPYDLPKFYQIRQRES